MPEIYYPHMGIENKTSLGDSNAERKGRLPSEIEAN